MIFLLLWTKKKLEIECTLERQLSAHQSLWSINYSHHEIECTKLFTNTNSYYVIQDYVFSYLLTMAHLNVDM